MNRFATATIAKLALRARCRHARLQLLFLTTCFVAHGHVRILEVGSSCDQAREAGTWILVGAALGAGWQMDLLVCHWRDTILDLVRHGNSMTHLRLRLLVESVLQSTLAGAVALGVLAVGRCTTQSEQGLQPGAGEILGVACLVGLGAGFLGGHRIGRTIQPNRSHEAALNPPPPAGASSPDDRRRPHEARKEERRTG